MIEGIMSVCIFLTKQAKQITRTLYAFFASHLGVGDAAAAVAYCFGHSLLTGNNSAE